MSVTLIAIPLFLVLAILHRTAGHPRSRRMRILTVLVSLFVLGLICSSIVTTSGMSGRWWRDDMITRGTLAAASSVTLVVALLESSSVLLAATCWSAGMLSLAGLSSLLGIQWAALQFSILPLLFYGRSATDKPQALFTRNPPLCVGSVLFGAGFLMLAFGDSTSSVYTIGIVFYLCGLGGMLGWFPFPRVFADSPDAASIGSVLGKRYLPALTAAVVTCRVIERHPLGTEQAGLLVLAAFFSLVLCSFRLMFENRLSRRYLLTGLSTFGFLLIAIFLQNWEWNYPQRDWQFSSNLPSGTELFVSILLCETLALLALMAGMQLLEAEGEPNDFIEPAAGVAIGRPLASVCAIAGLLSLVGIPPLPGFWWRWVMPGTMLLPHRQSNVTRVIEADHSIAFAGILLAVICILSSIAHLRLLQSMFFDEPFRVRHHQSGRRRWFAAACSMAMLLAISFVPLSISVVLEAEPSKDVEKPEEIAQQASSTGLMLSKMAAADVFPTVIESARP